jgi:hypothetical protein
MPDQDHYLCPICGTELGDSRALKDHERERHTQQVSSRVEVPSNEQPEPDNPAEQDRQHKKFERRNWE